MIKNGFYENLVNDFSKYIVLQENKFPSDERLKIDLHCHDFNSSVPDELMGRLLGVPETWLESEKLVKSLENRNCDVITVTNHNNALSCYQLQDKGHDILTGAEFSVIVPDFDAKIHVLAYGFTPEIEKKLNKRRNNLYKFMETAVENNIPAIWAHPLFHYSGSRNPSMEMFFKLSLVFERFETINGQRDTWQNMLVKTWVESLTPENIDRYSRKFGLRPDYFCTDSYKKTCTGGSDEHMGIFTGLTGSYLHVPELAARRKDEKLSQLALEALRKNRIAPYGSHHDSEKMMIAFIDYFCQIGMNIKDPGLVRLILHKGNARQKIAAFLISNAFLELKRHKLTANFLRIFHNSLLGEKPSLGKRIMIPAAYRPLFAEVVKISSVQRNDHNETSVGLQKSVEKIYSELSSIITDRVEKKLAFYGKTGQFKNTDFAALVENFEIPGSIRSIMTGETAEGKSAMIKGINIGKISDGLSFPLLASTVILGAAYTAAHVLYNTRPLLSQFSDHLNRYKYPERMLWLTDTFEDNNGVAVVLRLLLREIQQRNLPIDICVCSSTLKPEKNLIVLKPVKEFSVSLYNEQPLRIPDILQISGLFKNGEYDRVISSTEGFMGAAALFLKNAYSVPAYFYIHTDWMTFTKKVLGFEKTYTDRIKRFLRTFYSSFDGVFVLNTDQQRQLTGQAFGIRKSRVHLTAHWAEKNFTPGTDDRKKLFRIGDGTPVIMYSGRLSPEKGVLELPGIIGKVREIIPEIKIVFAGKGPSEEKLREMIPDAVFTGWIEHSKLPDYYSSADLLILPSRFDTFGCVVLESLSCGTPVAAYKSKGPKDIIQHDVCGFISENADEMAQNIISYLNDGKKRNKFRKAAVKRAYDYNPDDIIRKLLEDVKLDAVKVSG